MNQPPLPAPPVPRTPIRPNPLPAAIYERSLAGELDTLIPRLPEFARLPFGAERGTEHEFLDMIVRRASPGLPEVPVGVVSKRYRLLQHVEVADALRTALASFGLHPREMFAEAHPSVYGARMALFVRLPRRFDFDPGDNHPLALRVLCLNSVDGSSRLRILLGWYRYVCANGLAVGTTRAEWRLAHREGATLAAVPTAVQAEVTAPQDHEDVSTERPDIASVLRAGIHLAAREHHSLRAWTKIKLPAERFAPFADRALAAAWGPYSSARFLSIATTGFDAQFAHPFERGAPSAKAVIRTRRVPGSPVPARSAYDACQALAWIAKDRRDPEQRVARMLQIPELMQGLMGKN